MVNRVFVLGLAVVVAAFGVAVITAAVSGSTGDVVFFVVFGALLVAVLVAARRFVERRSRRAGSVE
jgi:membrane protein implicated in regulation of membrane protease activity